MAGPRDDKAAPVTGGSHLRASPGDREQTIDTLKVAFVQDRLTKDEFDARIGHTLAARTHADLAAAGRPFIYVPLARHFEQQIHVAHRLAQYRAGRRLDYTALDPEYLAEAIVTEIDRPVDYRPVETDGAARAADLLAELL